MDKIDQAIESTMRDIRNSSGQLVAFVPRNAPIRNADDLARQFSPEWFDERRRAETERRA